jgi:glycosyltransferase involved in cell wall biosynthesis
VKVAFVCPFFGPEASGGAEFAARSLAMHLAGSGIEIDVLTTCLLDLPHGITRNHHAPGVSSDGPLTVRRFPVESPDMRHFEVLNDLIIRRVPISWDEELQFMTRHVTSPDLIRFMAAQAHDYAFFCFIPYLFGTSCFGAQAVPRGKRILIPCFHDEGYADLEIVRRLAGAVDRFVFNSPAEERFARRQFHLDPGSGITAGLGVDTEITGDAARFRSRFGLDDPFILYAGRRDTTKNVHTLIDYFLRYRQNRPGPLKLVLIGPAPLPTTARSPDLVDLGFVTEQEKRDAYAAAAVFCQPSLNESFSYVLMEAWLCGTPCLVHEDCDVTRDHVVESGGGLYFRTAADFAGALDRMLGDAPLCRRMAAAGRRYVLDHYAWPEIIRRFKEQVFIPSPPPADQRP